MTDELAVCLFCAKKLGWVCDTVYITDATTAPRRCGSRIDSFDNGFRETRRCKATRFKQTDDGWKCTECRWLHEGRRKIVKRTRRYLRPGPNGDGLFCSKEHGWKFGLLAGRAGYRRKAA